MLRLLMICSVLVGCAFVTVAGAASEAAHVEKYCTGLIEFRLSDGSRVDCIEYNTAIEYDFSNKWAEAIGQSLYYALQTDMDAGIVIIRKRLNSQKHIDRLMSVIDAYDLPIEVRIIDRIQGQ